MCCFVHNYAMTLVTAKHTSIVVKSLWNFTIKVGKKRSWKQAILLLKASVTEQKYMYFFCFG